MIPLPGYLLDVEKINKETEKPFWEQFVAYIWALFSSEFAQAPGSVNSTKNMNYLYLGTGKIKNNLSLSPQCSSQSDIKC